MKASTLLVGCVLLGQLAGCWVITVNPFGGQNPADDAGMDAVVVPDVQVVSDVPAVTDIVVPTDVPMDATDGGMDAMDATMEASDVPMVGVDLPPTSDVPDTDAPDSAATVAIPDTTAGHRLAFLLAAINGMIIPLDEAAVDGQFDPSYLAVTPFLDVITLFQQTGAMGVPINVVRIEAGSSDSALVADCVNSMGEYLRIQIQTGATFPGLITVLVIQSDPSLDPTLGTWSGFDTRIAAVAPGVHMWATEITSGAPVAIHGISPAVEGPVNNAFGLYVLTALTSQINAGAHAWTDTLPIVEGFISLPPGAYRELPAGTTHSLLEFATQMIASPDCTATDHLMHMIGPSVMGGAFAAAGHSNPLLDSPVLYTREFFALKLLATPAEQATYIADDSSSRGVFLVSTIDPISLTDAIGADTVWITPMFIDQIDWFASPTDLTNAMVYLKSLADVSAGGLAYGVLSAAAGVSVDPSVFLFAGYVGGAEPGVLSMTWLLRRTDDRWFVLSINLENPTGTINTLLAQYLALAAIDLVALD